MPARTVSLGWPGGVARVDDDGAVELHAEGLAAVRLRLGGAGRLAPVLMEADVAEHEAPSGEVTQRVTVAEHCQLRWVIEGLGSPELEFVVPDGHHAWVWPSGADALVAVFPAAAIGPALVFQVQQGSLTWRGESTDGCQVRVALNPGPERQVTVLRALRLPALPTAAGLLPAWYQPLALGVGDDWEAEIADFGVDAPPEVTIDGPDGEGLVRLEAPGGHHRIGLHGRRGVTELLLEVCPRSDRLIEQVAREALAGAELSSAGAVVVQQALVHGDLASERFIEDTLDRFDWTSRGDPLAIAFGCHRAVQESEPAMVAEAVRQVLALPERHQQAQVRRIVAFAAAALGADASGLEAVMRPVAAPVLADRLHFGRRTAAGAAQLAGAINRLGAGLPGRPVGLGAAATAELVCLLDACPEHWPEASLAATAAQEARFKLFAGYAAGDITDPTALAWLLIGG